MKQFCFTMYKFERFMDKIDLHCCCVMFFLVCQRLVPIWSNLDESLLCKLFWTSSGLTPYIGVSDNIAMPLHRRGQFCRPDAICVWFDGPRITRKAKIAPWKNFLRFTSALGTKETTTGKKNYRMLRWWKFCSDLTKFTVDISLRVQCWRK